jgi:hypothetical protein
MDMIISLSDLLVASYAQVEAAKSIFQTSGKTFRVEECCILILEFYNLEGKFIVRNRRVLVEYKLFEESQVVAKLEDLKKMAHEQERVVFVQDTSRMRRQELLNSIDKLVGGVVKLEELKMVTQAMNTGFDRIPLSGHLYRCRCGYPYFVGLLSLSLMFRRVWNDDAD